MRRMGYPRSPGSKEDPCTSDPGRAGLRAGRPRGAPPRRAVRRATGPPGGGVCDCPFLRGCRTYNDPLISDRTKGPAGRGCTARTDAYRRRHCKVFACQLLCREMVYAIRGRLRSGRQPIKKKAGNARSKG